MLKSYIHILTDSINTLTNPIHIITNSINIPTNQINILTSPIDILTNSINVNISTNRIIILTNASGAASAQGSEQALPHLAPDPETEPPKLLTYGGGLCGGCAGVVRTIWDKLPSWCPPAGLPASPPRLLGFVRILIGFVTI